MTPKVVILGGGVGGLSAAHELAERGFAVEVYERRGIPGGKARSLDVGEPTRGRLPLAGEHGFRFFPGFYKHVVDTMRRIPCGTGSVANNLVDTTEIQIAGYGKPSVYVPARFPEAPGELQAAFNFVLALLGGQLDLNLAELGFLGTKLWQFVTSCQERRLTEYEALSWWDFIEAEHRSAAYKTVFGHGITRSLVAAKARRASTRTIGNIFAQMMLYILQPGTAADRVLNGPTNEVWIRPWLEHLRKLGVTYHMDAEVTGLDLQQGRIAGVTIVQRGQTRRIEGDYYVAAVPVERMAELVTPALAAADPALAALPELSQYVEWMNGIQFYLTEDVPLVRGHTIFLHSPWALTSVSQAQFWRGYDMSRHGDGRVKGILSVDISNWVTAGGNGKAAVQCTREEIQREVWEQIKQSVNVGGKVLLDDHHLHSWFLDPDIQDTDPSTPGFETNLEPLLVNYVDTWGIRPEATTRIPNLFLASDYVRTHTDLATMEAANEAARRATNGILAAARSKEAPCGVWPLQEPDLLLPLQAHDRQRFRRRLPWDGAAVSAAQQTLRLATMLPADTEHPDVLGPEGQAQIPPPAQAAHG
jgi:uncharacterized protein with NAD-binding domain and iron-sulfur cluster